MPRIHNYLQDCVIYLYPSEDHASQGERAGGSGFLVSTKFPSDPNRALVWAVSNKHVIEKAPVVRVNTRDGSFAILNFQKQHWIRHPNGDDLAVYPVPLNFDVHRFTCVPKDMLLTKDEMNRFDIGIGDEIFVVGRFVNHEGKVQNTPSMRFGTIAQMPDTIRQDTGFDQESFLVEAKSISGYSGSPVFVHMLPMTSRPSKEDPRTMLIVPAPGIGPWLLGIDWGHINSWESVRDETGHPLQQAWKVRSNTGMMGVVPAWKLLEIFQIPLVKELIVRADENWKAKKAESVGTTDIAVPDKNTAKVRDEILSTMLSTPPQPRKRPARRRVKRK